jgi:hypothetical protein
MRTVKKFALEDELKKEEASIEYQGISSAHPASNSPFYPKNGYFLLDG